MRRTYLASFIIALACVASVARAGNPQPLQAPQDYTGQGHIITTVLPQTTHDTGTGVGTSGANVCPLNANCTVSGNNTHTGTENFTGAFESAGFPQSFPASGHIVGTTDPATIAAKSVLATGATNTQTLEDLSSRHFSVLGGGAVPNGTTDATSAITAVMAAALADNTHEVWLDGKAGVGATYKVTALTVPPGIRLVCPGPVPLPPTNGDFRGIPGFITSNPHGITVSAGAGVDNCGIIPPVLNAAPPTTVQGLHDLQNGFLNGIGLNCTGSPCEANNDLIAGFVFPFQSKGPKTAWYGNLQLDGTTAFNIPSGGGIHVSGVTIRPYATNWNPLAVSTYALSGFADNGSGELEGTYSSSCATTNCPLSTYIASVIQPASAQSAEGEWPLESVTANHFDLVGSTSAFLTGYGQTGSTTAGSTAITGLTAHLNQYHPTQLVTASTCIPAGATIAAVWVPLNATQGTIYLDANHPATCSTTETITVTDTSTGVFGVTTAAIVSGGTCYTVDDLLTLVGGTLFGSGPAAQLTVSAITPDSGCSDPINNGAISAISITDPGLYTALPGAAAAVTGGTGTGATFTTNNAAMLVVDANMRYGACGDFESVTGTKVEGFQCLSHTPGIKLGTGANGVDIVNCELHDENYLQSNHIGVWITGGAKANEVHCNSYYSGKALLVDRTSPNSAGAANTFSGFLGGAAGASGLQNELFEVESNSPGTPCRGGLILEDVYSKVAGAGFISDDCNDVTINGARLPQSTIYPQSATTSLGVSGAGNKFASGSMPIYSVAGPANIQPGSLNSFAGSKTLANVSSSYTPNVDGSVIFDTGALTNNRNLTLSNTNATAGYTVTLIRRGSSGGFSRNVFQADGTTSIASIADGASADFVFNATTSLWVQK
jgi:hypothetical protein